MKTLTLPAMAVLFCSAASAQSMDYGAIEQLFGEPGTMSATGSPQRGTDVAANMVIITGAEIAHSGARDIPGILRHVPGVDVLEWANDDFDVSARGYNQANSARTLVLVDGRQVYADSFGFTPWSAVPVELSAIRQIEIVKGPNAALFGFNAVAGVINIITKNPRYDETRSLTARYGSQDLAESSAVARFALGQESFLRLSGGYRSDKPFGTANPLPVDGSPHRRNARASIDADAVFVLPENIELEIDASHAAAKQNDVSGGYKLQTSQYVANSVLGRLSADTGFGLVKLTGYNNWFDWTRAVGIGNPVPKVHNTVTVVQAEDLFAVAADHTIRVAAEYRHNEIGSRDAGDGWISFEAGSASAMWNWQIAPQLSWTSAVRFDSVAYDTVLSAFVFNTGDGNTVTAHQLNGPYFRVNEWSFNAGFVWNASAQDTFRLLAARGVQLPNLVQVWDAAAGQSSALDTSGSGVLTTMSALHLAPSTVANYEALWNHRFATLDAKLQIAYFHQETWDVISTGAGTIDTPGSPGLAPANVGSSRADGIEISANGRLGEDWHWQTSYRFEGIKDKYQRSGSRTDLVNYQDTTPQHVVKFGGGYDDGSWACDAFLHYQSDSAGIRRFGQGRILVPVKAYAALDARLAYRFSPNVMLALSGRNLVNGSQQQTSGPEVERQIFLSLSLGG